MSRLSIEISDQQHQQIKAMAAINGFSIKDYILDRALSSPKEQHEELYSEEELGALKQLEDFLAPRIAAAEQGEFSTLTIDQIIAKAQKTHAKKL